MAIDVKIPPAGDSITTASIAQWHKADGDRVARGDLLVTIETDKVSNELEAESDGVLKIVKAEGEDVDIGTVIATIEESEAGADGKNGTDEEKEQEAEMPEAQEEEVDSPAEEKVYEIKVPAAGDSITTASIAEWHKRDGESVKAGDTLVTLETDKVSNELEADADGVLTILSPEGEEVGIGVVIGRITSGGKVPAGEASPAAEPVPEKREDAAEEDAAKEDAAKETAPAPEAKEPETIKPDLSVVAPPAEREEPAAEPVEDGRMTRKRMSMMRRKIATQLVNVQQTAAILTTFNEADMTAVMKLRKAVQEDFVAKHGVKLGFMSFFVKAVVQALKEVVALNSRIDGNELVENHFYDIGVAVGTEKGLVVPVVRDADTMSFAEIEQCILDYALRARDGKIQIEDMQGGSFTISNGGVYGSLLSTPIINPPQSGILGMHTIQQRPIAVDGKVEIRPMMYLALSYDHRIVDGKGAVTFLIRIKEAIENPTRLMLEV